MHKTPNHQAARSTRGRGERDRLGKHPDRDENGADDNGRHVDGSDLHGQILRTTAVST